MLYVDDEEINRELFVLNFEEICEVLTAENGKTGLSMLENNPDIVAVFTDMRMPKMTGMEFVQQARNILPENCYYILTGFNITKEIEKGLENGTIVKYFKKPFDYDLLTDEIKMCSSRKHN